MRTAKLNAKLKANHLCLSCCQVKTAPGRVRCAECLEKQKLYEALHRVRIQFQPPAEELSTEELYRRAKGEREVVSWAWKNPANR